MPGGGYEIYIVEDASGDTSKAGHDYAMLRMIQVGVVPVTWQQVLLEWQRDWAHKTTYDEVMAMGAYGMGVDLRHTWSTTQILAVRFRRERFKLRCPRSKQFNFRHPRQCALVRPKAKNLTRGARLFSAGR
jgi:nicotinamidase-related amidase